MHSDLILFFVQTQTLCESREPRLHSSRGHIPNNSIPINFYYILLLASVPK